VLNSINVGKRLIGPGHACYVIAEAGTNHNGKLETALALVDCAADAGADAVKFQTFKADALVAPTDHPIAELSDKFGRFGATVHEMFRKVEMPLDWLPRLYARARERGIDFLSTPFDEGSVDVLDELGVRAFKIASYEVVHLPLLRHAARKKKPILLSTGMANLGEIEEAITAIRGEGNDQIALFHCAIGYPVDFRDIHLAAMDTMRASFGIPVGFSDHSLGVAVPFAVAARGGNLLEKHFTLDSKQHGPDHEFAIEPNALKDMVSGMRNVEAAIGRPEKTVQPSEALHYTRGRRSLFAVVDIPAGQTITKDMLAVLRPGVGLKPKYLGVVAGRPARRAIRAFQPLSWDDV